MFIRKALLTVAAAGFILGLGVVGNYDVAAQVGGTETCTIKYSCTDELGRIEEYGVIMPDGSVQVYYGDPKPNFCKTITFACNGSEDYRDWTIIK